MPLPQVRCSALPSSRTDCTQVCAQKVSERARISRELHDDLGQRLLALRLDIDLLGQAVGPHERAALRIGLEQLLGSVDDCIDAVRCISADLRPSILEDVGLAEALQRLSREWADRCGLQIEWLAGFPEDLHNDRSSELSWALYRMAQESLGNIARHAQARVVRLRLVRQAGEIVFTVDDDGRGAHPEEGHPGARRGLGLRGLAERFARLGGHFHVIDGDLGGYHLEARVPWPFVVAGPLLAEPHSDQTRSTH
jgi:signal transduction histidine kinase